MPVRGDRRERAAPSVEGPPLMLAKFGTDGRQMFAEVREPDMIERGAGVHRLRFPIQMDARGSLPAGIPLRVSAQFWLSAGNDWIGFAQPERPIITYDEPFHGHLVLVLSDEQLAVIEDRRAGSDLQLRIGLDLTLGYPPGSVVRPDDDTASAQEIPGDTWPTNHSDHHLFIQSGPWQRLLEQSSSGMSLAIVVPVPIGKDTPSVRAGELLRLAIRKVNAGEYSDAVVTARKAIDALDLDWATEKSIVSETAPQKRSLHQRRAMLRHALWSLASPAAHGDPNATEIDWDRASALSVIAAVAAFVAST